MLVPNRLGDTYDMSHHDEHYNYEEDYDEELAEEIGIPAAKRYARQGTLARTGNFGAVAGYIMETTPPHKEQEELPDYVVLPIAVLTGIALGLPIAFILVVIIKALQ